MSLVDHSKLPKMNKAQLAQMAKALEELHRRDKMRKIDKFYPDDGPLRRELSAGDTGKTVRDIIQLKLLGPRGEEGTGMIPGELLEGTTPKHGLPDAVESIKVKHVPSGGVSTVFLKSYDQRREAFQGTEIDVFWCDEEPPEDIYVEGLMRTMTTGGIVMVTFTPLMGISNVVKSFMPGIGHNAADLSH